LLPWTILSMVVILVSLLAMSIGIILHTVDRRFQELESHTRSMLQKHAGPEER
jgi:hypothetical protein